MDAQRQATGESHFVRDTNRYPLCGRGDVNTYAIFAENMRWAVSATGRVGCIVPSGIATDVAYIMETFRAWREKEVKQQDEYRTKRVILEIYDEMAQAMVSGTAYRTRLEPGPADAAVAHAARASVEVLGE